MFESPGETFNVATQIKPVNKVVYFAIFRVSFENLSYYTGLKGDVGVSFWICLTRN